MCDLLEEHDCCQGLLSTRLAVAAGRELPSGRQVSLLETLAAAASQMAAKDKTRPAGGPPPLLTLEQAMTPEEHLRPHQLKLTKAADAAAPGLSRSRLTAASLLSWTHVMTHQELLNSPKLSLALDIRSHKFLEFLMESSLALYPG